MRNHLPLILVSLITGCAAAPPAVSGVRRAVIIAVRPVAPAAAVLATIGATPGTAPLDATMATGTQREFILRTEDGRIVSIVQDDGDDRLRLGQSVSIINGDHASLSAGS